MNTLTTALIILGLYGAYGAGMLQFRLGASQADRPVHPFPRATLALVILVAIPTTLQFFVPGLLELFERNREQFLAGQYWRILTALVVQDGGLVGSIFNLVSLYLLGLIGERLWGGRRLWLIFWLGGLCSELVALNWQPLGAGNSVANFCIAASLTVWCLAQRPRPIITLILILTIGAYLGLFSLRDIHGAAALIGLGLGAGLLWFERRARRQMAA